MDSIDIITALSVAMFVTYFWRASGTYFASKITPKSETSKWVNCVAYGLLAGLISRILIFPVGLLAETTVVERLVAVSVGLVIYLNITRNLFVGTFAAGVSLYALLI
tara:strand:- start:108 stop:428 length:321 start_codon:yes stop_codon:yes gene_type:complete